ncbi:Zn-dependent protease [Murinocardiopsis flavida]|uniref:Zinc metalloprotease n=1 Tax=Murinocardiopsis flavida TaxID=645275 RepID=A0A2P8DLI3_9ACTN|nr:site-2 protease family protein [Murinocardiopsis flavida]PSK98080.1 Zn-dependent protease [Murinocardiopsis flavida]
MTDNDATPAPRRSGLSLGRLFGIPVHVAPSWLIIAAVITVVYQPTVEGALRIGPMSYLVAFVFAVLLYASVLVHELGHALVARSYGMRVHRISLRLLGGVTEIGEPRTPGREFWIAVAGPLLSLALAGIGYLAYAALDPATVLGVLTWQLWVANLLVGVCNLLPGLPLDGGRLLRAAVWAATRRHTAGTMVAAWVGRLIAVAIVALPFLLAWTAGVGVSLYSVVVALLIGSFMWMSAGAAITAARFRERVPRLRARTLARRAVRVTADTSVAEALRRMAAADAGAVVITDSGGTPTSIVHAPAAEAVPEDRGPWMPVSSAARAIGSGSLLGADLGGQELLDAMHAHPADEYLVVEPDGTVHGVLRTADVNAAFAGI